MPSRSFERLKVLINEDRPADAELVEREVVKVVRDPDFLRVQTREAFQDALTGFRPDLIISDYYLPQFDGLTALKMARSVDAERPFILVSGSLGEEIAIDTMRQGATDYVLKDRLKRLAPAVARALKDAEDRRGRVKTLEALRRSEERQAHILSGLPMALYTAKAEGGFVCTWIGDNTEQLCGYPPGRFVQDAAFWFRHIHPDDLQRATAGLDELYRTGSHTMEYRWKCSDGGYRWFLDRTVLLKDGQGRPVEILGTWIDVHERKAMEGRLVEREQLLDTIFEEAPVGIALIAMDGKVMLSNKRYDAQLGCERGSLRGRTVLEFTHADDRAETSARMQQAGAGSIQSFSQEKRYLRCDGTVMWAELTAVVLDAPASQSRFILTMLLDTSERRRLLDVLVRQERLRALGQMASAIAHDINNALSPVLGYAELLETQEATLSDRGHRYVRTIRTAAGDIARIVGRMKEFYQARGIGLAPVLLDPNALLEEAIEMTAPRWGTESRHRGAAIEIIREFSPGLTWLTGTATDIRECLVNLLFNAVDALPRGGRITLRSGQRGQAIVLEVQDTGTGMDAATRARCLEPFYTTKGAEGTGLGLSSVAAVMRGHGGEIEIDSEPGTGTTVRLVFPLVRVPGSPAPGIPVETRS